MKAYYNENDPYCCAWLSNLMDAGLITPGKIDDRSIRDIHDENLGQYHRVHLFAGVAGWELALNLAGWGERPVWTGSCPCQPFSAAGLQIGTADERHLWPVFRDLIAEWDIPTVIGEQVASALGRGWLAGVRADLEALDYAVGAADLSAAGAGAPHIRQRLYWVAHAAPGGWPQGARLHGGAERARNGSADHGGLGDADLARPQGRLDRSGEGGRADQQPARPSGQPGFWDECIIVPCTDGKARRAQSLVQLVVDGFSGGLDDLPPEAGFPLAKGIEGRIGALRGIGNAIVPPLAAIFIEECMQVIGR